MHGTYLLLCCVFKKISCFLSFFNLLQGAYLFERNKKTIDHIKKKYSSFNPFHQIIKNAFTIMKTLQSFG